LKFEVSMSHASQSKSLTRRGFAALTASAAAAPLLANPQNTQPQAPPNPNTTTQRRGTAPETPPFDGSLAFERREMPPTVQAFSMTEVRLLPGPYYDAQEWNRGYLHRLDPDRLVHTFRLNAGLPSRAEPLGGWEEPKVELRGHFTGHFLSACALAYSSTGDQQLKDKGDYIVAELAKCQQKLGGGYLSAFPTEFFDRLKARKRVWAPFYTIHKVMAGMLDMHQHCDNKQALDVLEGMSRWADEWTSPIAEPQMQDILNTEYGGMNEVLYNLAAVANDDHWAKVGDRFTKKVFFNPLGLRRDELRGLHVNTHIPQVIGAARRYELSSDMRFHDVADYFWYEVTSARSYVTGGTSNGEGWLTRPRRLAEELKRSVATAECCCAYNMLKLTRHLYAWTGDPRYFDYYERLLINHRLGAIHPKSGATMYYLSLTPGVWKTFGTEDKSFWCCTGTGVEEYAKLNDSIYFHDDHGLYINLFVPSELDWREKGLRLRQETKFPMGSNTTFMIAASRPAQMMIRLRIPEWVASAPTVKINGKALDASASPGSYLTLSRTWKNGDRIEMQLPMRLHTESMPDDPNQQAFLYGPVVLAGDLGSEGLTPDLIFGPNAPRFRQHPIEVPGLRAAGRDPESWIKPDGGPRQFRTTGQQRDVALVPLNSIFDKRYSVYWQVS
jgi:DUF1680 family protein